MHLKNHLLAGTLSGRSAKILHCDKQSGRLECPDTIVLHYTGGGNAMSSAHYLARAETDVSAHLVIGRDGGIIQVLPFDTIAWHAGQSEYEGRTNLNLYSIGIELDNAGLLYRRGNRFFSWFNHEYPREEVFTDNVNGKISYWHKYPTAQLETLMNMCIILTVEYPIRYIVRHSDITSRKLDPGPAFPFDEFFKTVEESVKKLR